jgi:prephenate dehydrogenase
MAPVATGGVGVVGLGVVGGSVAKALTRAGVELRAYAADSSDLDAARRAGIDVADDVERCVADAVVVLVAVPVHAHAVVAAAVAAAARPDAVLLHAASLQRPTALASASGDSSRYSPRVAQRLVGTHPIAGSQRSGFAAADAELFAGSAVSVESRADAATRGAAEQLWRSAGAARFEYRTADEHDDLMTWVSHLPQIASTALAHAIASAKVEANGLGPGGRDATRLAASSFEVWSGILRGAGPGIAHAAAALERSVGALRAALEAGDMDRIGTMWQVARAWRDVPDRDAHTPGSRAPR